MHAEPISRTISVYGRTAPARSINISAETEGRVELIAAARGKRVSRRYLELVEGSGDPPGCRFTQ